MPGGAREKESWARLIVDCAYLAAGKSPRTAQSMARSATGRRSSQGREVSRWLGELFGCRKLAARSTVDKLCGKDGTSRWTLEVDGLARAGAGDATGNV